LWGGWARRGRADPLLAQRGRARPSPAPWVVFSFLFKKKCVVEIAECCF
jgi:hypothetical protein